MYGVQEGNVASARATSHKPQFAPGLQMPQHHTLAWMDCSLCIVVLSLQHAKTNSYQLSMQCMWSLGTSLLSICSGMLQAVWCCCSLDSTCQYHSACISHSQHVQHVGHMWL